MGTSLVNKDLFKELTTIRTRAQHSGIELILPSDLLVARNSWTGPLETYPINAIPRDAVGISCGPQTVAELTAPLEHARTIFLNAGMGDLSRPETLIPLKHIMQVIAGNKQAYRVLAGGESVASLNQFGLGNQVDFCSTGGGATLAYLCGQKLPGLSALQKN